MKGLVEFMDQSEAVGWVSVPTDKDFENISLEYNDKKILDFRTTSEISRSGVHERIAMFSLRFKSIWRYMTVGDRLSFKVRGENIFVAGYGYSYTHESKNVTSPSVLFKKLDNGYIFNQKGFLRLSKKLDLEWQNNVIKLYNKVKLFLLERHGLELFVMSGTLLGAVRDGEFIGHDHDFDVGLISKENSGEKAKLESKIFSKDLIDHGFRLQFKPSCTYISHPEVGDVQIDLVRMYFDEDQILRSAFGFSTNYKFHASSYKGVIPTSLSGHDVDVPKNSENILRVIYGDDWRIPNPTFNWDREVKTRDKSSRLSNEEISELESYIKK